MGWFTMPVLYSLLGVAFIIVMGGYMTWFFKSKIKEQEEQQRNKES